MSNREGSQGGAPMTYSMPPAVQGADPRSIGGYVIVAALGKGGMARVYLALARKKKHGNFTKLLVLKVLRAELDDDTDFLGMFMVEARLAARLNHPNVVQTYEVGEDANRHYIAMEYLEGQALSVILARVGRAHVPLNVHLRILCDALDGLHYAHELADYDGTALNIVHRDVSPQNVFAMYTGQSKILDFGIAKVSGSSKTATGVLKGKAAYMAPEQATGHADRRADVFAVGVMLWEAIARRRIGERGEDDLVVLARRIAGEDARVREVAPDAPPELADICDRAMALDPARRFATAAEMRGAIETYMRKGEPADTHRVAELLEQNFAADRARFRAMIDEQVKRADEAGPIVDIQADVIGTGPTTHSGRKQARPGQTGARTVVLALAFVAVVGLGVALVLRSKPRAGPLREQTELAAAPTSVPSTPSAEPARVQTVTVAIRTAPAHATMVIDGTPVANPYRADVAADGSAHTVEVSARGFVSQTRTLSHDRAHDILVALKPVYAVAAPPTIGDVDLSTLKNKRPKRKVDDKDPYQ